MREQVAEAIIANALDAQALDQAIGSAKPGVVIDQLTSLPKNPADMPRAAAGDSRLRLESGGNLLRATQKQGA